MSALGQLSVSGFRVYSFGFKVVGFSEGLPGSWGLVL